MIKVKLGIQTIDLPYTIQVYGVTEELFDELVGGDTKAELLDGVMIVHSPASLQHEDMASFLGGLMSFYADAKALGKVIASGNGVVHLALYRKFASDVFFIRQERVPMPLPREFEGAPDLVVEVLSPSNRSDDLFARRPAYHAAGVPEIWSVDIESRRVIVDYKREQGYVEEIITEGRVLSAVLEGFWIHAPWLWTEPLPNRMFCLQEILQA